jgi:DNA-binding winged helix-turn-helix (wHTH) protein
MAAIARDMNVERVLLIYTGAPPEELVQALQQQRFTVLPAPLNRDLFWPAGSFVAGVVCSPDLNDEVRGVAPRLKSARGNLPLTVWTTHPHALLGDVYSAGFDAWLPADAPAVAVAAQLRVLCRLVAAATRPSEPDTVQVRNVSVDMQRCEVAIGDRGVTLTPTEFRIVAYLARRPGRVVSHAELFREVHGYDASEQEAKDILKVHIWRLRNKLTAAGADGDLIVNVRGFGYLLERRGTRAVAEAAEG